MCLCICTHETVEPQHIISTLDFTAGHRADLFTLKQMLVSYQIPYKPYPIHHTGNGDEDFRAVDSTFPNICDSCNHRLHEITKDGTLKRVVEMSEKTSMSLMNKNA